jgi:hypothetical protein
MHHLSIAGALALSLPTLTAAAQDAADGLELFEPWYPGLTLELEVERRSEQLVDGQWRLVDGFSSTWSLECGEFTSTEHMRLVLAPRTSRSLLAAPEDQDNLAHRERRLCDGLEFELLCDWYGVPERLLGYNEVAAAHAARRVALSEALRSDPASARYAALAEAHLPTFDADLERLLSIAEEWALPIGYTLTLGEPFEHEGWDWTSWSTVAQGIEFTYRLESYDPREGRAEVSRVERQFDDPEGLVATTPELASDPGLGLAPLAVERSTWAFDTNTGVPIEYRSIEMRRAGVTAVRVTTTVHAHQADAPR